MTIYELIKTDIGKLNNLRVPMDEPQLYHQIAEVLADLKACVKAIEDSDKASAQEEPEPAEGVALMPGPDEG